MANKMNVYYISIEGNTKHFLKVMAKEFKNINLHEITDQSDLIKFKSPFFCFVPTYVKGTQQDSSLHEQQPGLNGQIKEMDTLTMRDELGYKHNYENCLGVIGSGNRNFGVDCYCWTALEYHRIYHIPMLAHFELRGSSESENEINAKMVKAWNLRTPSSMHVKPSHHKMINPRLAKLEKQYHKNN